MGRVTAKEVVSLMPDATSRGSAPDRRWLILGVIGLAQLMVILDLTVMNIALPCAQRALGFTTADRQWVVTAYTLAFGSLLLLGGRLADLLGRKVTFLTGLAGFAGASAVGGASVNFAMLITARACQGAFAALLVPAALSILTTPFTEPKDRSKAFAVYAELTAPPLIDEALALVTDALGPIDILVNNAARQTHSTVREMSLDEWHSVIDTHLTGTFLLSKVAYPELKR